MTLQAGCTGGLWWIQSNFSSQPKSGNAPPITKNMTTKRNFPSSRCTRSVFGRDFLMMARWELTAHFQVL